jgi:hypothetical protein
MLLIRPEALSIQTGGSGARVTWREFYGHDQRIGLLTEGGLALVARADAAQRVSEGEAVGLSVTGPLNAFPQR